MYSNTTFDQFIEKKNYLIKSCIKKLNIYKDHDDFYQVGLIALYKAFNDYDPSKDPNHNFDVYAYYIILNYMKNELSNYTKRHIHEDIMSNDHANQMIEDFCLEDDVLYRYAFDCVLLKLTLEEQEIIKLKRIGFNNLEIAKIFNCELEQLKYRIKILYRKIRVLINEEHLFPFNSKSNPNQPLKN